MSYEYVKRTYGVYPVVRHRVRHTVTNRLGRICREIRSHGQYVRVKFEGDRYSQPCHPTELEYLGR